MIVGKIIHFRLVSSESEIYCPTPLLASALANCATVTVRIQTKRVNKPAHRRIGIQTQKERAFGEC